MRSQWMIIAGLILAGQMVAAFLHPGFSLAGMTDQENQKRTILSMQQAKLPPGVKLPPVDAKIPAKTETATFALG
jgi:hypothetical protein